MSFACASATSFTKQRTNVFYFFFFKFITYYLNTCLYIQNTPGQWDAINLNLNAKFNMLLIYWSNVNIKAYENNGNKLRINASIYLMQMRAFKDTQILFPGIDVVLIIGIFRSNSIERKANILEIHLKFIEKGPRSSVPCMPSTTPTCIYIIIIIDKAEIMTWKFDLWQRKHLFYFPFSPPNLT